VKNNFLEDTTVLVTGGTGSFGKHFVSELLRNSQCRKVIIYSRDELKQSELSMHFREYDSRVRYFLGDVRDKERLDFAMQAGVDYVVHAAALKQVPTLEYNPFEAVKTNIVGTQNVIDTAVNNGIKKVISLSTDKAAAPINLYGATKLASDKLVVAANNFSSRQKMSLSVVRYGNVFGSRGSVVPLFLRLKEAETIPVTDIRMTRFSITLKEGIAFVLSTLNEMYGGEIFVPKIPSYRLVDVAEALAPQAELEVIGIRAGEKLHEEMITRDDAMNTVELEDRYVILPDSEHIQWDRSIYVRDKGGKKCAENFSYNSKDNSDFLSLQKIQELAALESDLF
jgi:UDP-N-acetylglucosamine 4,6-dehydratase/5-epimerase